MENSYQNSTIAQILEDIIDQLSFEGESHSNIADILLSILNQTSYDKEPHSVLAELFLKLKAKIEGEPFVPYDKAYTSRIAEILLSILNETEYTDLPQSRIAELLLELKEELEAYTEITVSGSIVSFTTNVSKPLVKLEANIVATQDLHGQTAPYPSGGQLWDEEWEAGGYDNTTGEKTGTSSRLRCKNAIPVEPNHTYYIKYFQTPLVVLRYDKNGNFLTGVISLSDSGTFTTSASVHFVRFYLVANTYANNISINADSSDTAYHPYSNICPIVGWDSVDLSANDVITTINLGGTYYGCVLNITSGVLSVDKIMYVFDGSNDEKWVVHSSGAFQIIVSDSLVHTDNESKSNMFIYKAKSTTALLDGEYKNTGSYFYFKYSTATTLDEWKAFIGNNNLQVLATLATPFTIQLTPTAIDALVGNNTFFVDTGDIEELIYLYKGTPEA